MAKPKPNDTVQYAGDLPSMQGVQGKVTNTVPNKFNCDGRALVTWSNGNSGVYPFALLEVQNDA